MKTSVTFALSHPPANWKRLGIALQRGGPDAYDASVTGDPCIVWDEDANRYRMFYFAQRHENGKEINSIVQAGNLVPSSTGIRMCCWAMPTSRGS
jgi:hypothetical protein